MTPKNRIIVALDVDTLDEARTLVDLLGPFVWCFKVGLQLLTGYGIREIVRVLGPNLFNDGKFHDIPNTVGSASKIVANLGVKLFNVHASSGVDAMKAAVKEAKESLVLAVTILTSIKPEECLRIYGKLPKDKVLEMALDAKTAGCHGIICSPEELSILGKNVQLTGMLKVTPGVRPLWAPTNDQKRVMTPAEAIRAGADALVIGRPITNPPKEIGTPKDAILKILDEIHGA